MKPHILSPVCLALTMLLGGMAACRRATPPTPPPAPEPRVFAFTNTQTVVESAAIPAAPRVKPLVADFDRDGLKDLAVLETAADGTHAVAIYIRRPGAVETYYRGGELSRIGDGTIVGIGSSRRGEHTDLVLVVARENGTNDFLHLYNTGGGFSEALLHTPADGLPIRPSP